MKAGKVLAVIAALLCLAHRPAAARGSGGAVPGPAAGQQMTEDQLRQGLAQLKSHLEKRGEDEQFVTLFINDIQKAFSDPDANGYIPVTRQVFDAFIKYEVAWASKTRDSKNPNISPEQLQREVQRAEALKKEFQAEAHNMSPAFYAAFQAAVKAVKQARSGQAAAGLFGGQTDDSFSHVDAGGAALEQGDAAAAAAQASQAVAEDPGNSEAYSLQAAADYAQGDMAAAAQAASTALQLDPTNPQAQAVLSLTDSQAPVAAGALADAASVAGGLSGEIAAPAAADGDAVAASGAVGVLSPSAGGAAPAVQGSMPAPVLVLSAAGAPNAVQSADLTRQAATAIRLGDPLNAMGLLNRAVALDPTNTQALNLRAIAEAHDRDYSAALQDINRSLMIAPHRSASLDTKSKISNRAKDYAGALAAADEALRIDSRDAHAWFNRAHALAGQGDRAGMLEALRQAALLDPSYERSLQEALKQSPSEALTLLFPDRQGLLAAASRQAATRRRSSPFARFLRHSGIMPVLREFGARDAFGALGVLAVLLFLLWRRKDADAAPAEPWSPG